ncbi:hypothetical protein PRIPAC_90725 [Pristionchus pacificus]|uniref:Uncharacterized protein n=1 Tax=Pristionchus pacificus TaxID=54126 RepID=A0A2A6B9B4_PRIPA|nr:hypothetical protein PRIPAC_90725 [Pristionchus pacificus]|eukprot:PDM62451.1 hypothetical protein PRIPAC_51893 [Pristionchus pacificus]
MARNWNDELTKMIDAMPPIKLAAMGSFPDGDLWAMKGVGEITNNELSAFARTFTEMLERNMPALQGDEVIFNGERYGVTWAEVTYPELGQHSGRMVGKGGNGGFFAMKMRLAVIVALFEGDIDSDKRLQTQKAVEMSTNWNDTLAKAMSGTPAIKLATMGSFPDGDRWAMKGEGEITGDCFIFNGEHYEVTSIELEEHSGRMVGKGGRGGFFAKRIRSAVIIAVFEGCVDSDGHLKTQTAIESIAEYMKFVGY